MLGKHEEEAEAEKEKENIVSSTNSWCMKREEDRALQITKYYEVVPLTLLQFE
jgi:hypothetical protein